MIATGVDTMEQALMALVRTRRCMQLYPVANPVVREALQQLLEAFKAPPVLDPLAADAPPPMMTCEIRATGFHGDAGRVLAGAHPDVTAFARLLSGAGAKRLYFRPGTPLRALTAFVSGTMALERGAAPDSVLELSQPGVGLEFMEQAVVAETEAEAETAATPEPEPAPEAHAGDLLSHLVAQREQRESHPAPEGKSAAWRQHLEDILAFFLAVERGDATCHAEFCHTISDPARIAETYSYVGHVPSAGSQEDGGARESAEARLSCDALRQTLRHIAKPLEGMPQDMRAFALANMAEAVVTTDTHTRARLLDEVLPAGIGDGGVEDAIAGLLPPGAAVRVLLRHVQEHAGSAATLRAFFDSMEFPQQRGQVAAGLLDALETEAGEPPSAALRAVLTQAAAGKHGPAPLLPAGTETAVAHRTALADTALLVSQEEARALHRAAASAGALSDEQQDALSCFHVFAIGCHDEQERGMLDRLQRALRDSISKKDFNFANHVVQLALGLVRPDVREDAYPALLPYIEALHHEPNFAKFLAHLSELADSSGNARTAINALASGTAPAVFETLAREEVKARRFALLNLLLSMGPGILGYLREQVNHSQWYVVRNTLYLLGRLPAPDNLRAIERTLRHRDARVREEALTSLAAYDPKETAPLIARALSDPEEHLRARAAELLAATGQQPYAVDLIDLLRSQGSELRRQPEFALALVRALGVLCNGASINDIERLRRQTWLPGTRKRAELRAACAEAVNAIRARTAHTTARGTL
jgi:hypothetical protein